MRGKRILLVEPGYKNKYPPLGLMKIAAYHRRRRDKIWFLKTGFEGTEGRGWTSEAPADRVYITTLFSFEWKKTGQAIDEGVRLAGGDAERVFVGGIAASLMHEEFEKEERWRGVRFIKGLLDGRPAEALKLRGDRREFGAKAHEEKPIESYVPDYGILGDTSYEYPVHDAYFGYASRGCIRKCSFCGVPTLEGTQREMPAITGLVREVAKQHGEKKDLVLMDNNITASGRYKEVIAEILDAGFKKGARLKRKGVKGPGVERRVDFNQGVDARILVKSEMFLMEMAKICIKPLRIAFDHGGMRKVYSKAVRMAHAAGLREVSNYMLYNFRESPEDLYLRMRLNTELGQETGMRIWAFPMRYQPVRLKDRSHVGERWNKHFLRSFQIMLQTTKGVVTGSPRFFDAAYGGDVEGFMRLLTSPHQFVLHRTHYESGAGRPEHEEYKAAFAKLSEKERKALLAHLTEKDEHPPRERRRHYAALAGGKEVGSQIRDVLRFYTGDPKKLGRHGLEEAGDMREKIPPPEEFIEDAGLEEGAE